MRDTFLPFSPPYLGEEEIREVEAALRSGWISRGPRTGEFEAAFAERLGSPSALALNSCTSGLHLALAVHDIGPGDEVIAPTMTFSSSVNVVEHVGATPVLVDVESDTLNIDPEAVRDAITDRTRAIVVVHYGGHPAEIDRIVELADEHGLHVIEDAAHALPASYNGEVVGSTDRLTAFSFYATKNLTTGEGGMLTGDPVLLERARVLSSHGMSGQAWQRYSNGGSWFYEVLEPGFKYNMTDVAAALGLRQLDRLETMQDRRRAVVRAYQDGLADSPLSLPAERPDVESAWHLYPVRLDLDEIDMTRASFIEGMADRNIGTSVHFIPVHRHAYYRDKYGFEAGAFPVAEAAYGRLVSLPLHPGLTERDSADVIAAVRDTLASSR